MINTEDVIGLVICWYDKEQWELLAQLDPDGVDDTYEEWRNNAIRAISEIQSNGQKVVKISIKISEFQNWCKDQGIVPDGGARAEFAAMLAQRRSEDK